MRLIKAFFYSLSGLSQAFKSEAAFRLEVYGLIPMLCLLYLGEYTLVERLLMFFAYMLILIAELLNTALEKTIDRISLDFHPVSKMVKDVASAAVFIAIFVCATVWGSIVLSHVK